MYMEKRIAKDLLKMGLVVRSDITLRPYSKTMNGYYDPNTDLIVVYVYDDRDNELYADYNMIFCTVLHEYVHSLQHRSSKWRRRKGVMHDVEFWVIYNNLVAQARKEGILYEYREAS